MRATASPRTGPGGSLSHETRRAITGALIVACIASTAAHFTHNYLKIEHYPAVSWVSNDTIKVGILIAWPLLTAMGVLGYWLYAQRSYAAAYAPLAAYSVLGLITPGHFTAGNPHIPPFWYATIFTDAALGFAILAFAHWSAITASRTDSGGTMTEAT